MSMQTYDTFHIHCPTMEVLMSLSYERMTRRVVTPYRISYTQIHTVLLHFMLVSHRVYCVGLSAKPFMRSREGYIVVYITGIDARREI